MRQALGVGGPAASMAGVVRTGRDRHASISSVRKRLGEITAMDDPSVQRMEYAGTLARPPEGAHRRRARCIGAETPSVLRARPRTCRNLGEVAAMLRRMDGEPQRTFPIDRRVRHRKRWPSRSATHRARIRNPRPEAGRSNSSAGEFAQGLEGPPPCQGADPRSDRERLPAVGRSPPLEGRTLRAQLVGRVPLFGPSGRGRFRHSGGGRAIATHLVRGPA